MASLDNTFGVLLIGVVVAAVLYGFTCIQTWNYFAHYPLDPWHMKSLVIAVFISDTCHQALITHSIYTSLVTHFADVSELNQIVWSGYVEVFFNTFTTFLVQCFMAWRIYKLSNKSLLAAGSVMMFVTTGFIMGMTLGGRTAPFKTYDELLVLRNLSMAINVNSTVGDIYIAGFLCYLLQRSRTGFQKSDTMVTKLIMFTINTGLLTSVFALCQLISIAGWPRSFMYIGFYFCVGRLYCNSLLATLNARREIRDKSMENDTSVSLSFQGQSVQQMDPTITGKSSGRIENNETSIKVDTTEEYIQVVMTSC